MKNNYLDRMQMKTTNINETDVKHELWKDYQDQSEDSSKS